MVTLLRIISLHVQANFYLVEPPYPGFRNPWIKMPVCRRWKGRGRKAVEFWDCQSKAPAILGDGNWPLHATVKVDRIGAVKHVFLSHIWQRGRE